MRQLTYLLGAGASFNSIPIVNTMNERMMLFLNMIDNYADYSLVGRVKSGEPVKMNLPPLYEQLKPGFFDNYKKIVKEAAVHKTVDTYARKLYLRQEWNKLKLLKEFLCLYFAFEQSGDSTKLLIGKPPDHDKVKDYIGYEKHINTPIDHRYDVFMATLLNNSIEFPQNISIISWNYDHQIELAFMDYAQCGLEEAKERLLVYPRKSVGLNRVVKLNGSASQYKFGRKEESATKEEFLSMEVYDGQGDTSFEETLTYFSKRVKDPTYRGTALSFSWEDENFQNFAAQRAKELLSKTDELVVIGYSFPNFNRRIDVEIFRDIGNPNVNVQCSPQDYEATKENLHNVNENLTLNISYKKDLSQFYIPKSFLV